MSIFKKTLLMNVLALPVMGMICLTYAPTNAVAGFKWTPPSKSTAKFPKEGLKSQFSSAPVIHWGKMPAKAQEAPIVEETLPAPVTMETLDSLENGGLIKEANIIKTPNVELEDIISKAVHSDHKVSTSTAVTETKTMSQTITLQPNFKIDDANIIQGFGKEIPLVMALRQIIPPSKTFAFNKEVNLAQRVSWQGGKTWSEVLNDALFSVKLAATLHNNNIIMISVAPVKTIEPAPPAPPVPPKMTDIKSDLPIWRAYKGQTLRNIISTWSAREKVELFWSMDYDYRLHKDVKLEGSYETAMGQLLDEFSELSPQPYGKLSKKSDGQRILTIKIYDSM